MKAPAPTRIVEFIGCTGAGKSSLFAEILSILKGQGARVLSSDEAVMRHWGIPSTRFRSQRVRSLLIDALTFPFFIVAVVRRPRLWWLVLGIVWRDVEYPFLRLNIYRNVAKRLGADALFRQSGRIRGALVLVDEGLVHQADSLFAHPNSSWRPEELRAYVEMLSLPDAIVYVEAEFESLIERISARGHQRLPRSAILDAGQVERYLKNGVNVSRSLAGGLSDRVVHVIHEDGRTSEAATVVARCLGRLVR